MSPHLVSCSRPPLERRTPGETDTSAFTAAGTPAGQDQPYVWRNRLPVPSTGSGRNAERVPALRSIARPSMALQAALLAAPRRPSGVWFAGHDQPESDQLAQR